MAGDLRHLARSSECEQEPADQIEYERDEVLSGPDDVPILFYDPARFPNPVDVARLEWEALTRTPHRDRGNWEVRALSPSSLRHGSPFSDGRVEGRFLALGYVTNREDLAPFTGPPPATVAEQAAAAALQRALILAAAILGTVRTILGPDAPVWLRAEAGEVLAPMVGRRRSTMYDRQERKDMTRNRAVPLIVHDGLLFGCADFSQPRTVVASGYHQFDTLHEFGIWAMHTRQRAQKETMQAAVATELARMPRAALPGVALWACQHVAHCRIAVEEARWYHCRPRARALTRRFVRLPLGDVLDRGFGSYTRTKRGRRIPGTAEAPILRSQWLFVSDGVDRPGGAGADHEVERVEVSAIEAARIAADNAIVTGIAETYDHAGWERPRVRRLPSSLRRNTELAFLGAWVAPLEDHWDVPRGDLQAAAHWLGELRRWGSALLDGAITASLERVLHGCDWEEYERAFESADGQAAIGYLVALMPASFWTAVAEHFGDVAAGRPPVPVYYDNTDLVGPVVAARGIPELADPIVTRGPFLAFPQDEADRWTARAAKLGPYGLLVRRINEGKPADTKPGA